VGLSSVDVGTEREESVSSGGGDTGRGGEEWAAQEEDEHDGSRIEEEEAQMDLGDRLAEDRHDEGVGGIDAGEFHIEGGLVGGMP